MRKYISLLHAKLILECGLLREAHDWQNGILEEVKEKADCNLSDCK